MPNLSHEGINQYLAKLLNQGVTIIVAGTGVTIDARGMVKLNIVPAVTATYEYSKVDSLAASSHDAQSKISVAAGLLTSVPIEWPFYFIDAAIDDVRVSMV